MRPPTEIRAELDAAVERRAALWEELSQQHNVRKSAQAAELSKRIDALWAELRAAQARARYGPSDQIIARARAEDRLDREAERRLKRAA